MLDYAVASASMVDMIVDCTLDESVPWKPHFGVRLELGADIPSYKVREQHTQPLSSGPSLDRQALTKQTSALHQPSEAWCTAVAKATAKQGRPKNTETHASCKSLPFALSAEHAM